MLDLKSDYVFKRLFVEAPELLVELINAVRVDEPDIRSLQILNPNIEPTELTGKYIVLDVLAEDVRGHRYNVEMQVRQEPEHQQQATWCFEMRDSQQPQV